MPATVKNHDHTALFQEAVVETLANRAPLVMVLGQHAWVGPSGTDDVLAVTLEQFGLSQNSSDGWKSLLNVSPLPENASEWISERLARRPTPEWFSGVSALPWSAVFTSSFDPTLRERFSTAWRDPQPVLTEHELPAVVRSTARMPIYYLFGAAGAGDAASRVPLSRNDYRRRSNLQAIPMLNRLPETATALGLVVIEGLDARTDFLALDALAAVAQQMPPRRIFWFGASADDQSNPDIADLVASGHISFCASRVAPSLAALESTQRLSDISVPRSGTAREIAFGERQFSPPAEVRIRVEAVASVVDNSWTAFLPPLGRDSEYAQFRAFHGGLTGARGLVNGVRHGFAITRDFETRLAHIADAAIADHARANEPIFVHGQSGTGKSIALARLVARIRTEQKAAVLYSTARIPQSPDVDRFCELAEQHGATVTVIVCDCNAPSARYRDALPGLRSRGRRVVLVGSTYRLVDEARPFKTMIEAPDVLSEGECGQLGELLGRFGDAPSASIAVGDRNALATLYRILPSSRFRLGHGLGKEAQAAESELRLRGEKARPKTNLTSIGEQLVAVGLAARDETILSQQLDRITKGADDSAGRLIDLVMACGRLDCAVPINVLLRAVTSTRSKFDVGSIAHLFRGLDLFRWQTLETGEDLLVSPRLTLEAELICKRRLAGPIAEANQLMVLIGAARLSWDPADTERRFVQDVVQRLGPDGPLRTRYRESYLPVARELTSLRLRTGTVNPSLVLQEAVLRRSAIRENAVTGPDRFPVLEEAREAVQIGIDALGTQKGRGARWVRANLVAERAAIFGFIATYRAQESGSAQEIWSAYLAARTAARTATASSETYSPLDISLWVPADLLGSGKLSEANQLELKADIHATLDRIDPDSLPLDQQDRFNRRLYALGEKLALPALSEAALKALEAEGSATGYYLQARSLGPDLLAVRRKQIPPDAQQRAQMAATFLKNNWQKIERDERSLRYLLQVEWLHQLGQLPFERERAPLPFDGDSRRSLLAIARALSKSIEPNHDNATLYLEAVLSWLANEDQAAQQIWRDLGRETDFVDARRVIRRHLLTDASRAPVEFSGRIESEGDAGRYTVRLQGEARRVQLLARDFPDADLAYGRTTPPFAIAFNFIGPIADPIRQLRA